MVWPFSSRQTITPAQAERAKRKCGLPVRTLQNCWRANLGREEICSSLETQVVFCHAEVTCPDLAAAYQECFTRVVASRGKEPYSACDKQAEAMRKCLKQQGLYPIARDTRPGLHASV